MLFPFFAIFFPPSLEKRILRFYLTNHSVGKEHVVLQVKEAVGAFPVGCDEDRTDCFVVRDLNVIRQADPLGQLDDDVAAGIPDGL